MLTAFLKRTSKKNCDNELGNPPFPSFSPPGKLGSVMGKYPGGANLAALNSTNVHRLKSKFLFIFEPNTRHAAALKTALVNTSAAVGNASSHVVAPVASVAAASAHP